MLILSCLHLRFQFANDGFSLSQMHPQIRTPAQCLVLRVLLARRYVSGQPEPTSTPVLQLRGYFHFSQLICLIARELTSYSLFSV